MAKLLDSMLIACLCLWVSNSTEARMDPQVREEILQRLQTLRDTVKAQQDLIHSLESDNAQQADKLQTLKTHVQSVKSERTGHANNVFTLEGKDRRARSIRDDSALTPGYPRTPTYRFQYQRIAFYALQYSGQTLTTNDILHFDHETINVLGCYDVIKGVFMAPLRGVYIFSVSLSSSLGSTCQAEIVKNGIGLGVIEADSTGPNKVRDQGSVTVVTLLDEGDRVWVRGMLPNQSCAGNRDTMFSGALVWETP